MQKIVLANWKANFAPQHGVQWAQDFSEIYLPREESEVVIAVPELILEKVHQILGELDGVSLAAQSVSSFPPGNYTGTLPASWLKGVVRYALVGHRERRKYFHETNQDVANQVYELLAEEITPIICVTREQVNAQSAAFDTKDLKKIIWAYTPETRLEQLQEREAIEENIAFIARRTQPKCVLYGGGVRADNGKALLSLPGVAGIMLGRGCLDVTAFSELLQQL